MPTALKNRNFIAPFWKFDANLDFNFLDRWLPLQSGEGFERPPVAEIKAEDAAETNSPNKVFEDRLEERIFNCFLSTSSLENSALFGMAYPISLRQHSNQVSYHARMVLSNSPLMYINLDFAKPNKSNFSRVPETYSLTRQSDSINYNSSGVNYASYADLSKSSFTYSAESQSAQYSFKSAFNPYNTSNSYKGSLHRQSPYESTYFKIMKLSGPLRLPQFRRGSRYWRRKRFAQSAQPTSAKTYYSAIKENTLFSRGNSQSAYYIQTTSTQLHNIPVYSNRPVDAKQIPATPYINPLFVQANSPQINTIKPYQLPREPSDLDSVPYLPSDMRSPQLKRGIANLESAMRHAAAIGAVLNDLKSEPRTIAKTSTNSPIVDLNKTDLKYSALKITAVMDYSTPTEQPISFDAYIPRVSSSVLNLESAVINTNLKIINPINSNPEPIPALKTTIKPKHFILEDAVAQQNYDFGVTLKKDYGIEQILIKPDLGGKRAFNPHIPQERKSNNCYEDKTAPFYQKAVEYAAMRKEHPLIKKIYEINYGKNSGHKLQPIIIDGKVEEGILSVMSFRITEEHLRYNEPIQFYNTETEKMEYYTGSNTVLKAVYKELKDIGLTPILILQSYIDVVTGKKRYEFLYEGVAEHHIEAKQKLGMGAGLLVRINDKDNSKEEGSKAKSIDGMNSCLGDRVGVEYISPHKKL